MKECEVIIREFRYSQDSESVLSDINFSIKPGALHHIYGPSGCGKSTLLSILSGDLPDSEGVAVFNGDVNGLSELSRMRSTQDPQMQLAAATVIDELLLAPEYRESDAHAAIEKACESARMFCLQHILRQDTARLSFGQARILGLAGAWQYMPDLLLLDEPFVGLDCKYHQLVADAIERIRQAGGAVVLTHTSMLEGEEVIELQPQPVGEPGPLPEFVVNAPRAPLVVENLLWHTWRGARGLSFALEPGQMMILTGPNGSGKSQLLQRIAGIQGYDSGHISAPEDTIYVPQSPDQEIFAPSLIEETMIGSSASLQQAQELINFFDLQSCIDRSPILLSFGQKKRVSFIGGLLRGAGCLLIDEPMSGLDLLNQKRLTACLRRYLDNGGMVIAATHEMEGFAQFNPARLHLDPERLVTGYSMFGKAG